MSTPIKSRSGRVSFSKPAVVFGNGRAKAGPGDSQESCVRAIVTPMEGAYGHEEGHPGRFAAGA